MSKNGDGDVSNTNSDLELSRINNNLNNELTTTDIIHQDKVQHSTSTASALDGVCESSAGISSITSPLSQVASSIAPNLRLDFLSKSPPESPIYHSGCGTGMSVLQGHYEHRHHQQNTADSVAGELTVPLYYTGKNILVTGATGFIGKVLIEKLLRCCPDLECIYCIIRPKKEQSIKARLDEVIGSKVDMIIIRKCHFF